MRSATPFLRHKIAIFADLFRKGRKLAELNESLEQRVSERTAALARSEEELRKIDGLGHGTRSQSTADASFAEHLVKPVALDDLRALLCRFGWLAGRGPSSAPLADQIAGEPHARAHFDPDVDGNDATATAAPFRAA